MTAPRFELTFQRPKVSKLPTEPTGRPAYIYQSSISYQTMYRLTRNDTQCFIYDHNRPNAPLDLKIRMLTVESLETMLCGCVTWSTRACHYDSLRRTQHRFLTRCIGWRKNNRADHPISHLDTLIKTGSESIEATLRRRRILFAGFVARMEDCRSA